VASAANGGRLMDLSVLIPARHERWLRQTTDDVLKNIRGATDIIIVCDGEPPFDEITHDPRVNVVMLPEAIGQRAATNLAAQLSTARYVMKLDAHCAVSEGFAVELVRTAEYLGPDLTQIPRQHNLHVFDWRCQACQHRIYQNREPQVCINCGKPGPFERVLVWNAKRRPTDFWRFDNDLRFQYWRGYSQAGAEADISDAMTCLGACWFLERERFLSWGGLDEDHGSWGQMGVEIACKSWLSGGRMVTNKRCWFSHLFRTQGGDFGYPFPLSDAEIEAARTYSRNVWKANAWPQQVRPLSWLVQKFAPVRGWHVPENRDRPDLEQPAEAAKRRQALDDVHKAGAAFLAGRRTPSKGCVYYSHGLGDSAILDACRTQLDRAAGDLPIVTVTLSPLAFGQNVVLDLPPGRVTMFRQILAGLEAIDTDLAFLVEHDVLYHPSHFDFDSPRRDVFYYDQHTWRVDATTGRALFILVNQVSGLCADRQLLIDHYRRRLDHIDRHGQTNDAFDRKFGYEPGNTALNRKRFDAPPAVAWMAAGASVDIKSASCLTKGRWKRDDWHQRDPRLRSQIGWIEADAVPGWGQTRGRFREFIDAVRRQEVAA
jgi:hypothetical protein